jgi:hypothetical protein
VALTTFVSGRWYSPNPYWLERDSNPAFPLSLVLWEVHESLEETVNLSESVGVRHTEVISVTDTQANVYGAKPSVQETVNLAEALTTLAEVANTLEEDAIVLDEALDSHSEQALTLEENVTLNEAAVAALYAAIVALEETIAVSASIDDHPTENFHEELDEDVPLVESLFVALSTVAAVAESVDLDEELDASAGFVGTLSESVDVAENLASLADYLSFLVETVDLAASVDDTFILQVLLNDPVAFDEALASKARFLVPSPETVPITEAVLGTMPAVLNETVVLAEDLTSQGQFQAVLAESIGVSAALSSDTPGQAEEHLFETVPFAEDFVAGLGKHSFMQETIELAEELFVGFTTGRRALIRPSTAVVQDVSGKKEETKKLIRSLKGRDLL